MTTHLLNYMDYKSPGMGGRFQQSVILLAMHNQANSRLVYNCLKNDYHIRVSENGPDNQPYDLCIVDNVIFKACKTELIQRKIMNSPVLQPTMLLTENERDRADVHAWEVADDIILIPIPMAKLKARVRLLLQNRFYSLDLQRKNEKLELLEKAIDSTHLGIVISDAQKSGYPIIYCNKGFEKLTGYSREETYGKSGGFLHRSDTNQPGLKKFHSILKNHQSGKVLLRNYRKDGSMFRNELSLAPVRNDAGEVTHFIKIQNDITELLEIQNRLQESQNRWEKLVMQNPEMIMITIDGVIKFINPAGAEYLNGRAENLIGKSLFDLFPELENTIKERAHRLTSGKKLTNHVYRIKSPDGSDRYIQLNSVMVIYKNQNAIQSVGIDITKRIKAEEALRKSLDEKITLIQEIHHRVKNNLAIVSSLLELQVSDSHDSKLKDALDKTRMRILSIARVHEFLYRGNDLNNVNLSDYINELINTVKTTYENLFLTLEFELRIEPVTLNIQQAIPCGLILNELLTNAVKHAFRNRNEGKIIIQMKQIDQFVKMIISDNGVGIPATLDLNQLGTLGSTIIQTLIKQLNGTLNYAANNGTTIKIEFPKTPYFGHERKISRA